MQELFNSHLVLHGETTRNSRGRKEEVRWLEGEVSWLGCEGHGGQSVTSKANLEVQECLPVSKLFNQEKRSKKKKMVKTGKVMTIIESEILSLICFIVKNKVMNFRISVKHVGEFFLFEPTVA